MKAMEWTAVGVGLAVATGIGLVALGSSRWRASTKAQMARLEAARVPTPAGRYDAREIEDLPAPVQRYFRAVLKDGQPLIAAAEFELAGTINLSATGVQWKPFTSTQRAMETFHLDAAGRHPPPGLPVERPGVDAARPRCASA